MPEFAGTIKYPIGTDAHGAGKQMAWWKDLAVTTNAALADKAAVGHTHDDRYYTEAETDSKLADKSAVGHTHDDRYYTEAEVAAQRQAPAAGAADWNTRTAPAWVSATLSSETNALNYPRPGHACLAQINANAAGTSVTQVAWGLTSNWVRVRSQRAGVWTAWEALLLPSDMTAKWAGTRIDVHDLDTITTPGDYYQTNDSAATPARNYPYPRASTIRVAPRSTDNTTVTQTVVPDASNEDGFAIRTRLAGAWSGWDYYDSRAASDARYAALTHTHPEYATSAALDGKADTTHTHVTSDVSGLGPRLDTIETDYATKAELAGVAAGDSLALSDATVAGLLSDPASSTAQQSAALAQRRAGELYADVDYTGATDVSTALNAIIAQAATLGLPVRLGYGVLRVDAPIRPQNGTQLIGSGIGNTVIRPQGQANAISAPGPIDDCVFRDFEIDGTDQTMPESGYTPIHCKGIFIEYMRRLTVERVYIHDTGATGLGVDFITGTIHNVWAVNCGRLNDGTGAGGSGIGIGVGSMDPEWEPLTISNCHTSGAGRFGIFLETQDGAARPGGITITGCTAIGNLDGIGECGTTGAIIANNHVRDNTRAGIAIDTGTMARTVPGRHTLVTGNEVRGNKWGLFMQALGVDESLDGYRILHNHIWENIDAGIRAVSTAYAAGEVPVVRNLRIEGNDLHHNGGPGLHFNRTGSTHPAWSRVLILNNRAWSNGAALVTGEDCGFRITTPTDHLVIDGNHTWDDGATQPRSVVLSGAHTNRYVDERFLHAPAVLPA